jgi:hypothetical protein
MVMVPMLALSVVAFLAIGVVLYSRQRQGLRAAMIEDGFKAHEVRKAMRLHARGNREELVSYCRDVVDRNARHTKRDWTKADAYRELV